ncbi:MAG: hypothetical protein Q9222_005625 [Ikaeria aurantiellina]
MAQAAMVQILIILLWWLPIPSIQINIRIQWRTLIVTDDHPRPPFPVGFEYLGAQCTDIRPGVCCKPHPSIFTERHVFITDYALLVEGLLVDQFAAGWGVPWTPDTPRALATPILDNVDCAGAPKARFHGPGDWHRTTGDDHVLIQGSSPRQGMIFAASWVDLRIRFPPDPTGSRYLQWQNVRGLVWGSDTWSAESNGLPFPRFLARRRTESLNQWAQQGTAFLRPPSRWTYPDVYIVNGTSYTIDAAFKEYRDIDGKVFNVSGKGVG